MLLTPSSGTFFHSSGFTLRYEEQVRQEHTDGASQTATATSVRQALRCGAVSADCFAYNKEAASSTALKMKRETGLSTCQRGMFAYSKFLKGHTVMFISVIY